MRKIIAVKNTVASRITAGSGPSAAMTRFAGDNRGKGYPDMAMKILIVVVVGAAILAIMNTATLKPGSAPGQVMSETLIGLLSRS